jgi:chromosome segregation ATPase
VQKAQQEAREAKTSVQQLKHNLARAEKEIANAKAELVAVEQSRDEFQAQIAKVNKERDEALEFAQKAQEALARTSGQTTATAALQKQVAELNALVVEQQKLIDELQKGAMAEPAVALPTQPTPAEPNEG